jgi:hypothetical protein
MNGIRSRARRVVCVERGFEPSRLEAQQLATAYEHVLPEIRVVLAQGHAKVVEFPSLSNVAQSETISCSSPQQVAVGA